MYIHIVPTFAITEDLKNKNAQLFSVEIPEFNLKINSEELDSIKPYNNKKYIVGILKNKKNSFGILLYTEEKIELFTTIYTWKCDNYIQKHIVKNFIEDHELPLVSQCISYYMGYEAFEPRLFEEYKQYTPVYVPSVFRNDIENYAKKSTFRQPTRIVKNDKNSNYISEIHDELHLHSIEKERMENYLFLTKKYCKTKEALIVTDLINSEKL